MSCITYKAPCTARSKAVLDFGISVQGLDPLSLSAERMLFPIQTPLLSIAEH